MIKVEHLSKRYGDFLAVDDLSFEIGEGHVYGFLGPNGAGKSTTMNIITGCLSATEGKVTIDGYDIFEEPNKAKRLIGYLPEQPPLYNNESPVEYLRFVGEAKGLHGQALTEQIQRVMEETGITAMAKRRIGALSKGYRQRLGIAQALLGDPRVIILDEPTVGLDPIQIVEIRDLIHTLGRERTVVFSSHILSEVQNICDEILIITKGKLVAFDTPENLEKSLVTPGAITVTVEASREQADAILDTVEHLTERSYTDAGEGHLTVTVKTDSQDIYTVSRAISRAFAVADVLMLELTVKKANLEEIFLELTEKVPDAPEEEDEEEEDKE